MGRDIPGQRASVPKNIKEQEFSRDPSVIQGA